MRYISKFIVILGVLCAQNNVFAQCSRAFTPNLSARTANYYIKVSLNELTHRLDATQTITFSNQSPETVRVLRLYMYFNAFKNTESTFLKGVTNIFGQSFTDRNKEDWGWVEIQKITHGADDLTKQQRYIQLDDGNKEDQSVVEIELKKPILAGETTTIDLKWAAQVPKTIARAGRSKDFYFLCHWFPQLGVLERNILGQWDWNCHQFHRRNEFYADFGNYDVEITTQSPFVVGASGCLLSEKKNANQTITRHYHAEDVIDFAWAAYPHFEVQEDQWKGVNIRLLIPPEHANLGVRYRNAIKFGLSYMEQHLAKYPYPSITIIDPPFHGLRSGLMEYPTLVTVGTFYNTPAQVRLMESLVVHEFAHQFFMGIVASNEKEEPWLDEGFATYFEDRIIDAQFGAKKSIVNLAGYRFDNKERTRLEYTQMDNPREGAPARAGWFFTEKNFKPLIYSKSATTLRTLEQLIGTPKMDFFLQKYFERWKFKHPKGEDFMAVLKEVMASEKDSLWANQVVQLVHTSIYGASVLDYAVNTIKNEVLPAKQGIFGHNSTNFEYQTATTTPQTRSVVELARKGDWVFPVELLVRFEDGTTETLHWNGEEGIKVFEFLGKPKIVAAQIDPQSRLSLDMDLNNNSYTVQPESVSLWKYGMKAFFWVQNLFQTLSFLA